MRAAPSQYRLYSESNDRSKRADAKPIEHISEEAAKIAEIKGEQGPDLNQGTPVADVRLLIVMLYEEVN